MSSGPGVLGADSSSNALLLAYRGQLTEARATGLAQVRESEARGQGGPADFGRYIVAMASLFDGDYAAAIPDARSPPARPGRSGCAPAARRCWPRARTPRTPTGNPSASSGDAGWRSTSPAHTCSTASGYAGPSGGGTHGSSCAPRMTCSPRWVRTGSPSGPRPSCARPANGPGPAPRRRPSTSRRRKRGWLTSPRPERRTARSPHSCSSARAPSTITFARCSASSTSRRGRSWPGACDPPSSVTTTGRAYPVSARSRDVARLAACAAELADVGTGTGSGLHSRSGPLPPRRAGS
jgi:hypothetical protein